MALPDYTFLVAGTAITWADTGGDETLTLSALAAGNVREGDKSGTLVDGTLGMPEVLEFAWYTAPGTAQQGLGPVLFIGESDSATAGTNNPGGLSGVDAFYTAGGQYLSQLKLVGPFRFATTAGTNQQMMRFRYIPTQAYIIPVVYGGGASLKTSTTDHKLVMTPFYRKLAE